jgi:hypothetical protein
MRTLFNLYYDLELPPLTDDCTAKLYKDFQVLVSPFVKKLKREKTQAAGAKLAEKVQELYDDFVDKLSTCGEMPLIATNNEEDRLFYWSKFNAAQIPTDAEGMRKHLEEVKRYDAKTKEHRRVLQQFHQHEIARVLKFRFEQWPQKMKELKEGGKRVDKEALKKAKTAFINAALPEADKTSLRQAEKKVHLYTLYLKWPHVMNMKTSPTIDEACAFLKLLEANNVQPTVCFLTHIKVSASGEASSHPRKRKRAGCTADVSSKSMRREEESDDAPPGEAESDDAPPGEEESDDEVVRREAESDDASPGEAESDDEVVRREEESDDAPPGEEESDDEVVRREAESDDASPGEEGSDDEVVRREEESDDAPPESPGGGDPVAGAGPEAAGKPGAGPPDKPGEDVLREELFARC